MKNLTSEERKQLKGLIKSLEELPFNKIQPFIFMMQGIKLEKEFNASRMERGGNDGSDSDRAAD